VYLDQEEDSIKKMCGTPKGDTMSIFGAIYQEFFSTQVGRGKGPLDTQDMIADCIPMQKGGKGS